MTKEQRSGGATQGSAQEGPPLDLVGNAYDFLNESLSNATMAGDGETTLWKFAIVNIAQAIELLLKERLRREHFLLVYVDVERKHITVNVDQALNRLANCNVGFDKEDVARLKRAHAIRNSIVHFAIVMDEDQLRTAYTDLLEFANTFHLHALGSELHDHIYDDHWATEADLMADFRRQFIKYQGAEVIKEFPSKIIESQFILAYRIDGERFDRIPWKPTLPGSEHRNCYDCAVLPGQLHTPDCDTEECPKCGGQWINCDCEGDHLEY
jgi:hypothetical protein